MRWGITRNQNFTPLSNFIQLFFLNRVISGHIDLVEEKGGKGKADSSETKDNSPSYSTNIAAMTTRVNDQKIA